MKTNIMNFDEFVNEKYNMVSINENMLFDCLKKLADILNYPFQKISQFFYNKIESKLKNKTKQEQLNFFNKILTKFDTASDIFLTQTAITTFIDYFYEPITGIEYLIAGYIILSIIYTNFRKDLSNKKVEIESMMHNIEIEIERKARKDKKKVKNHGN